MMSKSIVTSFVGTLFATASFIVLAQGMQLKGDELVMSVSGKTFTGTSSRGDTWESSYKEDGSFKVRLLNKNWSDSGTWDIKDDRICSERTKRALMCYELVRVSDDEYHWLDERQQTQISSGPK
jgi:hypothetical protein